MSEAATGRKPKRRTRQRLSKPTHLLQPLYDTNQVNATFDRYVMFLLMTAGLKKLGRLSKGQHVFLTLQPHTSMREIDDLVKKTFVGGASRVSLEYVPVATATAMKKSTCLVVSLGERHTFVSPVIANELYGPAVLRSAVTGHLITHYLQHVLLGDDVPQSTVRFLKETHAKVCEDFKAEEDQFRGRILNIRTSLGTKESIPMHALISCGEPYFRPKLLVKPFLGSDALPEVKRCGELTARAAQALISGCTTAARVPHANSSTPSSTSKQPPLSCSPASDLGTILERDHHKDPPAPHRGASRGELVDLCLSSSSLGADSLPPRSASTSTSSITHTSSSSSSNASYSPFNPLCELDWVNGLHQLILASIAMTPPEYHIELLKNIVIEGECSKFTGIVDRLRRELSIALVRAEATVTVCPSHIAWRGSAILSSSLHSRTISREEYQASSRSRSRALNRLYHSHTPKVNNYSSNGSPSYDNHDFGSLTDSAGAAGTGYVSDGGLGSPATSGRSSGGARRINRFTSSAGNLTDLASPPIRPTATDSLEDLSLARDFIGDGPTSAASSSNALLTPKSPSLNSSSSLPPTPKDTSEATGDTNYVSELPQPIATRRVNLNSSTGRYSRMRSTQNRFGDVTDLSTSSNGAHEGRPKQNGSPREDNGSPTPSSSSTNNQQASSSSTSTSSKRRSSGKPTNKNIGTSPSPPPPSSGSTTTASSSPSSSVTSTTTPVPLPLSSSAGGSSLKESSSSAGSRKSKRSSTKSKRGSTKSGERDRSVQTEDASQIESSAPGSDANVSHSTNPKTERSPRHHSSKLSREDKEKDKEKDHKETKDGKEKEKENKEKEREKTTKGTKDEPSEAESAPSASSNAQSNSTRSSTHVYPTPSRSLSLLKLATSSELDDTIEIADVIGESSDIISESAISSEIVRRYQRYDKATWLNSRDAEIGDEEDDLSSLSLSHSLSLSESLAISNSSSASGAHSISSTGVSSSGRRSRHVDSHFGRASLGLEEGDRGLIERNNSSPVVQVDISPPPRRVTMRVTSSGSGRNIRKFSSQSSGNKRSGSQCGELEDLAASSSASSTAASPAPSKTPTPVGPISISSSQELQAHTSTSPSSLSPHSTGDVCTSSTSEPSAPLSGRIVAQATFSLPPPSSSSPLPPQNNSRKHRNHRGERDSGSRKIHDRIESSNEGLGDLREPSSSHLASSSSSLASSLAHLPIPTSSNNHGLKQMHHMFPTHLTTAPHLDSSPDHIKPKPDLPPNPGRNRTELVIQFVQPIESHLKAHWDWLRDYLTPFVRHQLRDREFLEQYVIPRYQKFVYLKHHLDPESAKRIHPDVFVELAWQAHMCRPLQYRAYSTKHYNGRILPHDLNEVHMAHELEATDMEFMRKQWKRTFAGESFTKTMPSAKILYQEMQTISTTTIVPVSAATASSSSTSGGANSSVSSEKNSSAPHVPLERASSSAAASSGSSSHKDHKETKENAHAKEHVKESKEKDLKDHSKDSKESRESKDSKEAKETREKDSIVSNTVRSGSPVPHTSVMMPSSAPTTSIDSSGTNQTSNIPDLGITSIGPGISSLSAAGLIANTGNNSSPRLLSSSSGSLASNTTTSSSSLPKIGPQATANSQTPSNASPSSSAALLSSTAPQSSASSSATSSSASSAPPTSTKSSRGKHKIRHESTIVTTQQVPTVRWNWKKVSNVSKSSAKMPTLPPLDFDLAGAILEDLESSEACTSSLRKASNGAFSRKNWHTPRTQFPLIKSYEMLFYLLMKYSTKHNLAYFKPPPYLAVISRAHMLFPAFYVADCRKYREHMTGMASATPQDFAPAKFEKVRKALVQSGCRNISRLSKPEDFLRCLAEEEFGGPLEHAVRPCPVLPPEVLASIFKKLPTRISAHRSVSRAWASAAMMPDVWKSHIIHDFPAESRSADMPTEERLFKAYYHDLLHQIIGEPVIFDIGGAKVRCGLAIERPAVISASTTDSSFIDDPSSSSHEDEELDSSGGTQHTLFGSQYDDHKSLAPRHIYQSVVRRAISKPSRR